MKKTIVIIIVLIIVAAGASLLVYKNNKKAGNNSQPNNFTKAQAGNLVSGFPSNLLLIPGAKVNESYSYTNQNQFTAVLTTTDSASDVYNKYMNYFKAQKYKIISSSPSISIYANSPTNDVSVQISKQKNGQLTVNVTYIIRKK